MNRKLQITEAATGSFLWEKVFLEILQNSQENIRARVSKNAFFIEQEIVLAHFQSLSGRSTRHVFWENDVFWEKEGKMHDGVCVKEFFR